MVVRNQLQLTGLDGIKAIGGSLAFNVGPYDQLGTIHIHAPGEPAGLLRLFQMPQVDLTPQPWVPATAASYQSVSWDLDAAYQGLKDFTDQNFAQGLLEGLEQQIVGPQGQRIRFQQDIFGPLGNRITVVSDFETPGEDESQRVLFAISLDDAAAFSQTIEKLIALAGAQPQKRQFEGTTIYQFEIPEMPVAGAQAAALQGPIHLAVARDHLFVASKPSILEQAIRGGGPSLRESTAYQAAAKYLPAQASTLTFTRPEEQARVLYNLFQSGQLGDLVRESARNAGMPLPQGDLIDPAKVPDFSVFEKYISQSAAYGIMEDDGVTFTQFTLKKQAP
jgi:hypothetical protein